MHIFIYLVSFCLKVNCYWKFHTLVALINVLHTSLLICWKIPTCTHPARLLILKKLPHLIDLLGLKVTHTTYFQFLKHIKQLLLLKFCDMTTRIGDSFWTHENAYMDVTMNRWRDRRGSWNSYQDYLVSLKSY